MKSLWIIGVVVLVLIVGVAYFLVIQNAKKTDINSNPPVNPETGSKMYNINIVNFAFTPASLTIKKGDGVIWTNEDGVSHTVTSDSGNELDSEMLGNGQKYQHVFENSGIYEYHCTPHPGMKAKIIVE